MDLRNPLTGHLQTLCALAEGISDKTDRPLWDVTVCIPYHQCDIWREAKERTWAKEMEK